MSEVTVELPETLRQWIEERVRDGNYASAGEYLRELISRDRAEAYPELSLDDLRRIISESRESGIAQATFESFITDADRIARERGILGD